MQNAPQQEDPATDANIAALEELLKDCNLDDKFVVQDDKFVVPAKMLQDFEVNDPTENVSESPATKRHRQK